MLSFPRFGHVSEPRGLTRDDVEKAALPTVVRVVFQQGKVASAEVAASSGNPDLDRRLVKCNLDIPGDLTATVTDRTLLSPFDWSRLSLWK
jgi:hypothetical protein